MFGPAGATRRPAIDTRKETPRRLRRRTVLNVLRMGHCAPTVMQTLLDASGIDAPWLVKLTPFLKGVLPRPVFDVAASMLGVTTSMLAWRGHSGSTPAKAQKV